MLGITASSGNKDLLRIDRKAIKSWLKFLFVLTIYRCILFYFFGKTQFLADSLKSADFIPWQATLFVFWEDACHTIPLVLFSRLLGKKWYTMPIYAMALIAVMASFGLGHTYQGGLAALLLSLYIPFTIKKGKELGFGTMMVGHTLYDLVTILFAKALLGVM